MFLSLFTSFEILVVACFGLAFGSFSGALVYRIPKGLNWTCAQARSACPHCGHLLRARDLVPLLSWCLSAGKCRYCGVHIPVFYPAVELFSMAACLAVYGVYGYEHPSVWCLYAAVPFLSALFFIDLKHMILPNQLIVLLLLMGVLRGILLWAEGGFLSSDAFFFLSEYVGGAILYVALFLSIGVFMRFLFKREMLGLGDVKFFAVCGLWLGLSALPFVMISSGLLGIVVAALWRHFYGRAVFPFGPALILSFFVTALFKGML